MSAVCGDGRGMVEKLELGRAGIGTFVRLIKHTNAEKDRRPARIARKMKGVTFPNAARSENFRASDAVCQTTANNSEKMRTLSLILLAPISQAMVAGQRGQLACICARKVRTEASSSVSPLGVARHVRSRGDEQLTNRSSSSIRQQQPAKGSEAGLAFFLGMRSRCHIAAGTASFLKRARGHTHRLAVRCWS